jgi:hypothetical protein
MAERNAGETVDILDRRFLFCSVKSSNPHQPGTISTRLALRISRGAVRPRRARPAAPFADVNAVIDGASQEKAGYLANQPPR